MGIGKRIYDLARANLNALVDRVGGDGLGGFSDEELASELELRSSRKQRADEARAARAVAERAARERTSSTRGASTAGSSSTARDVSSEGRELAALYALLETPLGADHETVK